MMEPFPYIFILLLVSVFYSVNASMLHSFELTWNREVEDKFKEMHPDLDKLNSTAWPLVETLTVEYLQEMCNNVIIDTCPPFMPSGQYTMIYVPPDAGKLQERIFRNAAVKFQEAPGNNTHVFKMDRDMVDNVFLFDSGLYALRDKGT